MKVFGSSFFGTSSLEVRSSPQKVATDFPVALVGREGGVPKPLPGAPTSMCVENAMVTIEAKLVPISNDSSACSFAPSPKLL